MLRVHGYGLALGLSLLTCFACDEPRSGEILALSYNVAGLPEPLSGSEPLTNTPYISPLLNDYDLVLVQESWLTPDPNPYAGVGLRTYHELLEADALHPYRSASMPMPWPAGSHPMRPIGMIADGLNRFSDSPFGPLTRVPWNGCFGGIDQNDGGAADCLAVKGFSVARHVLATGLEVDVYNLHAEAGSTAEDQRLSNEDFIQLAAYINANSSGRAVIMGGDTNLHTGSEPDRGIWQTFLTATGLRDVCGAVSCGSDANRIDKFAFRSNAQLLIEPLSHRFEREKFVRPDGARLSDHDALAVRFRWTRR